MESPIQSHLTCSGHGFPLHLQVQPILAVLKFNHVMQLIITFSSWTKAISTEAVCGYGWHGMNTLVSQMDMIRR